MDMVMMRGLEYTAVVYSVKPRVRSRRKSPWNFKRDQRLWPIMMLFRLFFVDSKCKSDLQYVLAQALAFMRPFRIVLNSPAHTYTSYCSGSSTFRDRNF